MSAENRHLPHLKLVKVRQKVEAAFAICEKKNNKNNNNEDAVKEKFN